MRVIRIRRTIVKKRNGIRPVEGRSLRKLTRDFFAKENQIEFAIEALLFGTLLAISTWPIAAVASAISQLL
jgi:hypothetical protein